MMLADAKANIVYANNAVTSLFNKHLSVFNEAAIGFDTQNLEGQSSSFFCKPYYIASSE